jgi:hypothetical protein
LKRPYLPLLYLRNKTNSAFFEYLQKLGAGGIKIEIAILSIRP